MIGALVGITNIPDIAKQRLIEYDCTMTGRIRSEFLSVRKYGIKNVQKLIELCSKGKFNLVFEQGQQEKKLEFSV